MLRVDFEKNCYFNFLVPTWFDGSYRFSKVIMQTSTYVCYNAVKLYM